MTTGPARRFSRRHLLSAAGAAAGIIALAACGGAPETPAEAAEAAAQFESGAEEPKTAATEPAEHAPEGLATEAGAPDATERADATAEATPAAQAAMPPARLEFATSHGIGPRGDTVRFALEGFAARNPSVFVDVKAPQGEYAQWVATTLASGVGPHVVLGDAAVFQQHRNEHLANITTVVKKLDWQAEAYHFIPDSYTDNGGDLRVPPSRRQRGPLFGLPYALAIDGWLFNESLFEEAGVQPPGGLWTWNDALDLGRQLTDPAGDQWGVLALNSPEYFWIPLLYSNGVPRPFLQDGSGTGWLEDGDAASEAFEWAVDLIHDAQVAPPVTQVAALSGGAGDPFSAGRVAMWPSGAFHATGFFAARIGQRFRWSLASSPASPQTGIAAHVWQASAHLITTRAVTDAVLEPAVALAAHFASTEVQTEMAAARGSVPALISATSRSAALAPPPENLVLLRGALTDRQTRHLYAFFPTWHEWLSTQAQAAAGAFTGSVAPDEALVAMVRDGDRVLDARWGTRPDDAENG